MFSILLFNVFFCYIYAKNWSLINVIKIGSFASIIA